MKKIQLLRISTRVFITRPGRTALTVLGIAIGIGAVVFLVSLGYGLQKMMFEQITTEESLLVLDVSPPKIEIISIDKDLIHKISQIENVSNISYKATFSGQITLGNVSSDLLIYPSEISFLRLGGFILSEGKYLESKEEKEIILSTALLKTLDLKIEESIGKKVNLTLFKIKKDSEEFESLEIVDIKESYKIIGIIEDNISSFAYLSIETVNDLNINVFSDLKVKVSSPKFMEVIREELIDMGFMVSSLSEIIEEANKVFNIVKIILAIFGMVALFVAAVGLVNTMTVALLERTNEIGIMKAIGGEDKDIGKMFLTESTMIGFLGGVGGIILSKISSFIFNGALNILAKGLGGVSVNIFYTPSWFIFFILVFSTIVGFLSGFFPAKRAEKLNPLEALRYK